MDWKGIVEKVIVAVIAGSLLSVFGFFISATFLNERILTAKFNYIEIGTPFASTNLTTDKNLDKTISPFFDVSSLNDVLGFLNYKSKFAVGVIELKNSSDIRSKSIDLSIKSGFMIFSSDQRSSVTSQKSTINSLDPNASMNIYFISDTWYISDEAPVQIIYDDRKIAIRGNRVPDYLPFYQYVVTNHEILVNAILWSSLLLTVYVVVLFIISIFIKDTVKKRAEKITTDQIEVQIKIIDYVQKHFPEKMPKLPLETQTSSEISERS